VSKCGADFPEKFLRLGVDVHAERWFGEPGSIEQYIPKD
jgi:hypothetical protein